MRTYRNSIVQTLVVGFASMVMIKLMTISPLNAQIPQLINYQGKLTDLAGDPMPDGAYDMKFSLYNAESGGTLIWGPEEWSATTEQVQVTSGLFTVLIGTHQSLDSVPFDIQYWMELEVFNDTTTTWETFSPRWKLASSPYSFRAKDADTLGGTESTRYLSTDETGTIPGNLTATGTIESTTDGIKLPDGTTLTSATDISTAINMPDGHSLDAEDGSPVDALFVDADGKVGIGNTQPSRLLDVAGDIVVGNDGVVTVREAGQTIGAAYDEKIAINRSSASKTTIGFWQAGTQHYQVGLDENHNFVLQDNNVSQFIIDVSGNIGIGTTNPQDKLEIGGSGRLRMGELTLNPIAPSVLFNAYWDGEWKYASDEPAFRLWQRAEGLTVQSAASGTVDTSVSFSNAITVDPSGRVGIGTTTPSEGLVVKSGGHYWGNYHFALEAYDSTDKWQFYTMGESADHRLRIGYNQDEIMTLLSNGNIGIGTDSPSEKLQVEGDVMLSNNNGVNLSIVSPSGGGVGLVLKAAADEPSKNARIYLANTDFGSGDGFTITYDQDEDKFKIADIGGSQRFTIDTTGNVGIGTTNPSSKLHVNGTVTATTFSGGGLDADNVTLADVKAACSNNFHNIGGTDDDSPDSDSEVPDSISINNGRLYAPAGSGNVGIGTNSPSTKLQVKSSASDTDVVGILASDGQSIIEFSEYGDGSGAIEVKDTNGNSDILLNPSGNSWLNNVGNVGINTSGPQYDLDVNGEIKARVAYRCPSKDLAEKLPVHPAYHMTKEEIEEIVRVEEIPEQEARPIIEYGEISMIEPGTVVIITREGIVPCNRENDTRLAGVVSTAPALKMGSENKGQYIALAGNVPCKVTGKIEAGDMLTTSNIPGHAQKADEFIGGAMVGKALEDFDGESGVIEVWRGGI